MSSATCPQDDIVPLELSVEQALDYSAQLRLPKSTPAGERRRLVIRTIEALGLHERARTRVGSLSGGQRKRVSVAAELLGRPRLLLLDEPTSGLDPAAESALMELLRRLAANGCTVVCTTHVMENAYLMDRLAILRAVGWLFTDRRRRRARISASSGLRKFTTGSTPRRSGRPKRFPSLRSVNAPSPGRRADRPRSRSCCAASGRSSSPIGRTCCSRSGSRWSSRCSSRG